MQKDAKILVVDDEEYTRQYFKAILADEGYHAILAKDGKKALDLWSKDTFDLIILDIRMPGLNGIEVLKKIRDIDKDTMIIMISAYGDIDSVIETMRLGANDFFLKPFSSMEKIKVDIKNCLDKRRLIIENYQLRQQVKYNANLCNIIYKSKAMTDVIELASRAAIIDSPVLIEGETGTGKELIARYIHMNSSRRDQPFFAINCGAVPEGLLETTLFGHEKGAFTGATTATKGYFEAACGGTVFLDEISETSPSFQVKLLRVIQESEIRHVGSNKTIHVNFRLISATNKDLLSLVNKDAFRKDLFYRINVIKISVPPLRQRPEDIPILLDHFMRIGCEKQGLKPKRFTPEAISVLKTMPWDGNVRELQNLVERIIAFSPDHVIDVDSLLLEYKFPAETIPSAITSLQYNTAKRIFEQEYLKNLLSYAKGNLKKASLTSGLNLVTLYRKKNKYLH
ncbi:MAG: sigma-54-dependent Fis family transcriptional regulator [Deltaproteobacteria bacterium]|nr:sigma-54-dependent Fis family transcriptional regulator [Deltaproteobacteria bacterium]